MKSRRRALPLLLLALAACVVAGGAAAQGAVDDAEPSLLDSRASDVGRKAFDAVVNRPLRFVSLVASGVAFVPAAILSSPGGREAIDVAFDSMVQPQWQATFQRRLGDL